jgi:ATP/maltotriose-dependent transcriptional regulator MalT
MTKAAELKEGRRGMPLTHREREVLALVFQGMTDGAVADRLGVARHTVGVHLCTVYDKLGARTRVQAIGAAARLGLLPAA